MRKCGPEGVGAAFRGTVPGFVRDIADFVRCGRSVDKMSKFWPRGRIPEPESPYFCMTKTKRLWQRRHNSESTSSWTKPWPRATIRIWRSYRTPHRSSSSTSRRSCPACRRRARQEPHHPHARTRQTAAALVAGEHRALREQRGQDRDSDAGRDARRGAQDGAGLTGRPGRQGSASSFRRKSALPTSSAVASSGTARFRLSGR